LGQPRGAEKNSTRMIIDFQFVDFHSLEDTDIVPVAFQDTMDRTSWENLFHSLPQDQLEVLVCLFLGLSPDEVVKALHYPNIVRFYNVNAKLKASYNKQKQLFF